MADENIPQTPAPAAPGEPSAAPAAPPVPSAPPASVPPMSGGGGGAGSFQGRPPGPRPAGGMKRGKRNYPRKKKVCRFCADKVDLIDYKKADQLASFIQERGKILPRRVTGTCARHQRWLMVAIKRARNIALLPFATEM
jgi:small subunit ribosomal protein S18